MPRGGYQRPTHPAPASGPGALSQRTDGGQPVRYIAGGDQCGDGQDMLDIQSGAPMAADPGQPAPAPAERPTPLHAPTERPDEPVTAGAPFGPGAAPQPAPQVPPGPGADPGTDAIAAAIRAAYAAHPTPGMNILMNYLEAAGR